MISYFNSHSKIGATLRYSTPSDYFDAVRANAQDWPTYSGDFIPYADELGAQWTGYFSTRPTLKARIRETSHRVFSAATLLASSVID